MPSSHFDDGRDYGFADQAVALRKRAGLTQRELGAMLGVSEKAIGAWEAGLTYPGAERLQPLIALYRARAAFGAGREQEEAAALWESVRARAPRRTPPFDPRWFASLRGADATTVPSTSPPPIAPALPPRRHDWGEAPATPVVQGRVVELATLAEWVRDERCRVVEVLGVGGIGKTTLAARTAHDLAPAFAVVYWRSLRNAPPVEEWLAGALGALSAGQAAVPDGRDARLGLLLDLLRDRRALLVLDNLETILEPGAREVRYRAGYEGYEEALRRLAEGMHAGCLLLTSREQPLPTDNAAVRALHLEGLGVDAGQALLGSRGLAGDAAAWQALVARYGGNPLALRVVAETVGAVFGGDLAAFLAQDTIVFGGIRQLLDAQVARLSPLERAVLTWLAVEREPVGFAELVADRGAGVARGEVVEAVEALLRRSLLEWGPGGMFTIQPVVLEDATGRLIASLAGEILTGAPTLLVSQALLKATAKDYVRRSQERLIARPLLELLTMRCGSPEAVERRLLALLGTWRGQPPVEQGYGPGNVVNLLRLLRGNLRGLDLSHLTIRHAYLPGVEAQETSLAGALLSEAVLDEAFTNPMAVALSADGAYLAMGTSTGEVNLRRVADRTLLMVVQGHTGPIHGVAVSGGGRLVASGSFDGTVKLWEGETGRLLATLEGHAGPVWRVALSRDGRMVASGGDDGTVRLWEALPARGSLDRLLITLQGHIGGVPGVALSGDGRMVASGGDDGTVRLWDAQSGRPLAVLRGHTDAVRDVALSVDGRLVVSGSQDGTVRLWDAQSGRPLAVLRGHTGVVWGVALSMDGHLVASGGQDRTARLWDAESGRLLTTLEGHIGPIQDVVLSGDGRLVASGGEDGTARLWEAEGGRLLATVQGQTSAVWGVALSVDGRLVASGSRDGTVRLWDVESGRPLITLEGHTGPIQGVALSADGRLVASGSQDGTIRLWGTLDGRLLATAQGHSSGLHSVALSGDGRLVVSGSWDGTVRLWDAESGRLLTTLERHTGGIRCAALSADGRVVAGGSDDGVVTLWDTQTGVGPRELRADRRYERLDITGLAGITDAQRTVLVALGAVEQALAPVTPLSLAAAPHPSSTVEITASTPRLEPVVARPSPRPPTNVPPARTSFIGRAADLTDLARVLDPVTGAGARLLTLSGMAGCGKTRLALTVAEALRDAYADGVWLVALAPLTASPSTDPAAVAGAAVTALDLRARPGQALLDTLVAYLQTRRLLLVLDNCEHVAAACAALTARLLEACPELRILTTSQQALGIADETVWPVGALALPPASDGTPTPATLGLVGQSEAVRLFVERAQAVRFGFALSMGNASAVATICRRLDGLPLALELAAAHLHVLPMGDLLARLDDRFRLLRHGGRAATDRHETLQATLDWSYSLLDPAEQALLRRLAVFAGGWDVAAAEAVCAGDEVLAEAVLELLDELLERSLVSVVDEADDAPRYGLLETVRQYGAQHLERAGEATALRDRHLAWYVALAEQAAPALLGGEPVVWLARLEREHDNLGAALQWALDHGRSALGVRLVAGLWPFWRSHRSHLSAGRRWLAAVLALPAEEDEDTARRAARVNALEGAAWLAEDEHDFAQASALFARSDALRHALGQDERRTSLLINEAMAARAGGDYARATALLEETLARQRARGNRESITRGGLGLALSRLALVLGEQGHYTRATALYEECLALHRALGDREGVGYTLLGLGDIARDLGETARVRAYCEETLAIFQELGHPLAGFSLNNLALADYRDGDLARATDRAEEGAALFRDLRAGPNLAEVLVTLGRVRGGQGAATTAWASLAEALTLAWAKGPRVVVAAALDALGVLAMQQGPARQGVHLLGAAARLRQDMGAPVRPADRPEVEGALAAARASLGGVAFDEAWAAGQTRPLAQIVAHTVAVSEDVAGAIERADGA